MNKLRNIIVVTLAILVLSVMTAVAMIYIISSPKSNTFSEIYDKDVILSYFPKYTIYGADGQIIDKINERGYSAVSSDDILQSTKNAFISIEDARFYEHGAIDSVRLAKATAVDVATLSAKEGASTITQQLAKNAFLSSKKTIDRKLKELKIARQIEEDFTKEEILCAYLNCIYFGNDSYGISNASKRYFKKSVNELLLDESALLAGIINNPSKYNPYNNNPNAENRKKLVLEKMTKYGYIDEAERERANKKTAVQNDKINNKIFIDYVEKKGDADIETLYDSKIQAVIENALTEIDNSNKNVAIMVMDARKSKLVAATSNFYNDATRIYRQPGSIIKPILCYAPFVENNELHPLTPLLDEKTEFDGYAPKNYKNAYYGWISAEECLAKSLNIPAVKLLNAYGIKKAKTFAEKFGIEFTENDNGLSLALGGMSKGVNLFQICKAYSIFADNGKSIISPETAYFINKMLSHCADEGTAKKLKGLGVAAKTGTVGDENGNFDAYCVSYSTDYVVLVWHSSEENCKRITTGGDVPTEICKNIWKNSTLKRGAFKRPSSIVCAYVDSDELNKNHKIVLSNSDTLPYKKICAEFSIYNMPKSEFKEDLPIDGENFNILDSFI